MEQVADDDPIHGVLRGLGKITDLAPSLLLEGGYFPDDPFERVYVVTIWQRLKFYIFVMRREPVAGASSATDAGENRTDE